MVAYFRHPDPREIVAAMGVLTVAALCWMLHILSALR